MPLWTYVCRTCKEVREHLFPLTQYSFNNTIVCPKCGADAYRPPSAGTGIQLGGGASTGSLYPYYDRGLGRHVESHADRERIMLELGVVADDTDYDVDKELHKATAEERRLGVIYKDYADRMDNSPEFAEARDLRAQGHPDFQWVDGT